MNLPFPPAPALIPMTRVRCEVGALVTLGAAKYGERRYVPLGGGTVVGPELNGTLVEGGVDWQVNRSDGVLDIAAHYVIRTDDGALVEVQSDGMRHGDRRGDGAPGRWRNGGPRRVLLPHHHAIHHRRAAVGCT